MSDKGDKTLNREMTEPMWATPRQVLMERHRWNGGYLCECGVDINSPQTWSAHVLEEAWLEFCAIGAEGGRLAMRLRVEDALRDNSDKADWKILEAVKAAVQDEESR